MEKTLLLSVLLLAGASAGAQTPQYLWNRLHGGAGSQDNITSLVLTADSKLVSIGHFTSTKTTDKFTFGGEEVASGTASTAVTYNPVVIKHNADGSKAWAVAMNGAYAKGAPAAASAATSDGGVVFVLKTRASKLGNDYFAPRFVDASGTEVPVEGWNTSAWVYQAQIVKLSATGEVEWSRFFVQDQTPLPGKTAETTDAVTPSALTVDASGNIYVGGSFSTPMAISGTGNSCHILTPRNISEESADGGLFLVKLDPEGNYLSHLNPSGAVAGGDRIFALKASGDKVYLGVVAPCKEGESLNLGNVTATLPAAPYSIVTGALSTALVPEYLAVCSIEGASNGRSSLIPVGIEVIDGSLYVYGGMLGSLHAPGQTGASIACSGTLQEGFAYRTNAADGSFIDARIYGTGISQWDNVFAAEGKVWLYGYRMNAAEGVTLRSWDGAESFTLASGVATCTTTDCAFEPQSKTLYAVARGGKNLPFSFYGTEEKSTAPAGGFAASLAAFKLDTRTSAVEASAVVSRLKLTAGKGIIIIESDMEREIEIFDISGIPAFTGTVKAGKTELPLASGLYVCGSAKLHVR